jgi:hypothetical protein
MRAAEITPIRGTSFARMPANGHASSVAQIGMV